MCRVLLTGLFVVTTLLTPRVAADVIVVDINGGAAGGLGLRAFDSHVYVSGGSITGGQGGGGSTPEQSAQVAGGNGVHLLTGSLLRTVGTTPVGGLGGELVGGGNAPAPSVRSCRHRPPSVPSTLGRCRAAGRSPCRSRCRRFKASTP
jgi:hypothetical protein